MATKKEAKKPVSHSPFLRMKEQHGDKETLVDRLLGVIDLGGVDKETVKGRLLAVSNKKLLRMVEVGHEVKEKYGSPDGLAQAAAKALGHAKDAAYVAKLTHLAKTAPARLLDVMHTAARKTKAA